MREFPAARPMPFEGAAVPGGHPAEGASSSLPLLRVVDVQKTHTITRGAAFSFKELAVGASSGRVRHETVEALRGVSFDLHPRECLGVVGRNGAGKSTLLRLIAGVTTPDAGRVDVRGTVASLIELGAGFHPDLSGVENVFLMASLTGVAHDRVRERLREIVAFAGVEEFLFTPIKHYSSGMVVRLAFSIAVHFDPGILLLDEVMAVGDSDFQQRSRARIEEMRAGGAAIVLVSHDLDLVERVCDRVLWLEGGRVQADGDPVEVVGAYVEEEYRREALRAPSSRLTVGDSARLTHARFGSGELLLTRTAMIDAAGRRKRLIHAGEPITIEIDVHRPPAATLAGDRPVRQEAGPANVIVTITRRDGVGICYLHLMSAGAASGPHAPLEPPAEGATRTVALRFDRFDLAPGGYQLSFAVYPASAGDFPRRPEDYPYDCHLRMYEFSVAAPPGEAWEPAGGVRLRPEVVVEVAAEADEAAGTG